MLEGEPRVNGPYNRYVKLVGKAPSVGEFLGEGSYGVVFVHPTRSDRIVKIGRISRCSDNEFSYPERHYRNVIRFVKELIKKPNPSIMRVYSFEVLATVPRSYDGDSDVVYFAMTGERLLRFKSSDAALSAEVMMEAASSNGRVNARDPMTIKQAEKAVKDLSRYPYYHTDIHHGNVMRNAAGDIKLVDIESFEPRKRPIGAHT